MILKKNKKKFLDKFFLIYNMSSVVKRFMYLNHFEIKFEQYLSLAHHL